jgi:hypothetical protein
MTNELKQFTVVGHYETADRRKQPRGYVKFQTATSGAGARRKAHQYEDEMGRGDWNLVITAVYEGQLFNRIDSDY